MRTVERVAASDASVLVLGESGTGKGLVARTIHATSARADQPFMHVDCGAIAASVFESELFGHERGAFTGATRLRRGPIELAHGGTLFLDEIGELPLELQPKLLRVIEDHTVTRVGAHADRRGRRAHHRGHASRARGDGRARWNFARTCTSGCAWSSSSKSCLPLRARRGDLRELVRIADPAARGAPLRPRCATA